MHQRDDQTPRVEILKILDVYIELRSNAAPNYARRCINERAGKYGIVMDITVQKCVR